MIVPQFYLMGFTKISKHAHFPGDGAIQKAGMLIENQTNLAATSAA